MPPRLVWSPSSRMMGFVPWMTASVPRGQAVVPSEGTRRNVGCSGYPVRAPGSTGMRRQAPVGRRSTLRSYHAETLVSLPNSRPSCMIRVNGAAASWRSVGTPLQCSNALTQPAGEDGDMDVPRSFSMPVKRAKA